MIYWLRYPLLCVGVAQIAGILSGWAFGDDWGFELRWIWTPLLCLIACGGIFLKEIRPILWVIGGFLWGVVSFGYSGLILSSEDIRAQMGESESRFAVVRGELIERPSVLRTREGGEIKETSRTVLRLDEIKWEDPSGKAVFQNVSGNIQLRCPVRLPSEFRAGSRVEVEGTVLLPRRALVPGGFDYRSYLNSLGICYQFKTERLGDWKYLGKGAGIWSKVRRAADQFRGYSVRLLSLGAEPDDPYIGMYQAMTLGERTALLPDMKDIFTRVGVLHLFAISGGNVAIVAVLLFGALSILKLPQLQCYTISLFGIWFYALVVGAEPPVTRAAVMFSIVCVSKMINRPGCTLNSLGMASFLLLSWDPVQLFQAGFQLSFAVVLGLILLIPSMERQTRFLTRNDSLLPSQLVSQFVRIRNYCAAFLILNAATAIAGEVGALPLCVHHFQLIPLVGIFVNMIVVPLMFPVQGISLFSIALGSFWEYPAVLLNDTAAWLLYVMSQVCTIASKLPYAYLHVPGWSPASWILYYVGIAGVFGGFFFRKRYVGWLSVYLLVLTVQCFVAASHTPTIKVTIFPASDGSSICIQNGAESKNYLIDVGTESICQWNVLPYLKGELLDQQGLDGVILTHGDAEHLRGMQFLTQNLRVNEIYVNPLKTLSPYMKAWSSENNASGLKVTPLIRGNFLDKTLEVLHPDPKADGDFTRADQGALVLRLTYAGKRILFISDLDPEGQQRLMDREPDLKCDILVAGVAQYEYEFRSGFLKRTNPQILIVEVARQGEKRRHVNALFEKLEEERSKLKTLDTGTLNGMQIFLNNEGCHLVYGEECLDF